MKPDPRRDPSDSLWRADRRALTLGLVLTITLVGFEALAISTVMPIVAEELGGLELYGWVFSAFFLGSLIGIVVVGGAIDRGGLARAVRRRPRAVRDRSAGRRPRAVDAGPRRRPVRPGSRRRARSSRSPTSPSGGRCPKRSGRGCSRRCRPPGSCPASSARRIAGAVGETIGWRFVFLGLLPLIALAGALTLGALRAVVAGPGRRRRGAAAAARRGRLPLALTVALGAGLLTVGLTTGEPVPTRRAQRRSAWPSGSSRSAG